MRQVEVVMKRFWPSGVPFQTIGALADVGTGNSDRKDATEAGEYPFYVRSTDVMRKDTFEFDEEAILIPGEGGIGDILHYVNGKYALHQRVYRIHFTTPGVDAKFAYYYFLSHFKRFILGRAVSATVTSIRKPMITDFRLPIPPLDVQHDIVRMLDQFVALEAELEAELVARRLQYRVYLDKLLNFEEAE
jgi:restriction endonuclease S subunit